MATSKSISNRNSGKKGKWTEKVIKQVLNQLGLDMVKPIWVNPSECPDYRMNCDVQLPHLKVFLEIKSSLRDGGLFKLFSQSKAFKKAFPGFKFIVIVTNQTGDEKGKYKEYLLSYPYIDDVLYINKSEMGSSVREQKSYLKDRLENYFEELMMNHIKSEGLKINESKDLDYEDKYVPFLTQPMRTLLERKNYNFDVYRTNGNLTNC